MMTGSILALDMMVSVVRAVQLHFHAGCVFLLYSEGNSNQDILFTMNQLMAEKGELMGTIEVQKLATKFQEIRCQKNIPLYVILSSNEQIRRSIMQVSQRMILSSGRWLLFLDQGILTEFFSEIYVPFDCEFLVAQESIPPECMSVSEVYHMGTGLPLNVLLWGTWNPESGLRASRNALYIRRQNMQGVVIKSGAKLMHPSLDLIKDNGKIYMTGGFCGLVWDLLQRQLNFTLELHETADESWGRLHPNGSWTGLVGMLPNGEAEIINNYMLMNEVRSQVAVYVQPILQDRLMLYIRYPQKEFGSWDTIIRVFNASLWFALIIVIFILIISLLVLHHFGRSPGKFNTQKQELWHSPNNWMRISPRSTFKIDAQQNHSSKKSPEVLDCINATNFTMPSTIKLNCNPSTDVHVQQKQYCKNIDNFVTIRHISLQECIFNVLSIFFQKDIDLTGLSHRCHSVVLLAHLTALVVTTAFCSQLISFLSVHKVEPPFTTFNGMLQDGSYRMGILARTGQYYIFKDSKDDLLKTVYTRMIAPEEGKLPVSDKEGFERVCHEKNYGFFAWSTMAESLAEGLSCTLMPLPQISFTNTQAFMFRKHSPYRRIIKFTLEKFRHTGTLDLMKKHTYPGLHSSDEEQIFSLPLASVQLILLLLLAGIGLASIAMIVEYNISYKNGNHKRSI